MNRDYFTADQFLRSNRICRPTREPRALLPDPDGTLVASDRMARIDVAPTLRTAAVDVAIGSGKRTFCT
jgi:hypothetical protein